MKPILPALLLCCCLVAPSAPAFDLTPHFITRITKGQAEHIPTFRDGETQYTVTLPGGVTAASGGPGETVFYFRDFPEASFQMKASPFAQQPPFNGPALQTYRRHALQCAPTGATDIALQEETADPFPFNDWSSYRYTLSYKLPGRSFLQSVTFLNLGSSQQILLVTHAPSAEFERASSLSWDILRTWRPVSPGEDLSVPPPL
ncbi:MAG: hypothetical protein WCH57_03115 [Verrucomicrobiota bacterium]